MGYELYRSKELAHAAKGSSWTNHKYIDKFLRNGKWIYIYKGMTNQFRTPTTDLRPTTKEYVKVERNGGITRYKEVTSNGNSWLSNKIQVKSSDGSVTVFKTKGKIERGVEKAASKGASFIQKLSKKKKSKKSRIKVTSHTTTLG